MGLQENGNGNGNGNGEKNRYKRMEDSDSLMEEDDTALVGAHQPQKINKNTKRYVLGCAIFASLNSVLLGYDIGVMSGAVIFMREDLNLSEVQEEVLIGILSIISLLGSLAGGKTSDAIGRKWTIALAAVVFQTGVGIMAVAHSFTVLMIGRLLAGIGIGFGVMVAPVYIVEISPTVSRGSLTSFPEIFTNVGILLGYISNYVFSGLPAHISWRVMLGVGILPSVFIGCALCIIPESPRWLVMKNRIDEARMVLSNTNERPTEVEERLAEIQKAAAFHGNSDAVWREFLSPSPGVLRMLIAGCGIQCFQQITGIDATVYYSPQIFKDAGLKSSSQQLAATVGVGFTKTVFILAAIFLIDKVGRKPLLYVSTVGMTASLFGLGLTLSLLGNSHLGVVFAILSVCGNVAFFSIGLGPICWVLSSEIFPLRLRAQASALGAVGSRVSSGVITMSFLSVSEAISVSGTFFVFAAISALAVVFVYKCVPETKGKSLEQIEMLFEGERCLQGGELELGDTERLVQRQ